MGAKKLGGAKKIGGARKLGASSASKTTNDDGDDIPFENPSPAAGFDQDSRQIDDDAALARALQDAEK